MTNFIYIDNHKVYIKPREKPEREEWKKIVLPLNIKRYYEEKFKYSNWYEHIQNIYKISNFGRMKSSYRKGLSSVNRNCVNINYGGITTIMKIHRLVAFAFCCDDIENKILNDVDVDHIDGNDNNNMYNNLQILPKSIHSKKTRLCQHTKETRKKISKSTSIPLIVIESPEDSKFKPGYTFNCLSDVKNNLNYDLGAISKNVSRGYKIRGHLLKRLIEEDLPGEIWKNARSTKIIQKYGKIKVSNKGRIYTHFKQKFRGTCKKKSKYTSIQLKKKQHQTHRVIYEVWHDTVIPEGLQIDHKEKTLLDNKHYYRNHIEDLEVVTPSENSYRFQENKRKNKTK